MLRRRLCMSPCVILCIVQPDSVPVLVIWQQPTSHVTASYCQPKMSQRCSIGDRLGALEGQSRVMTTVRCHILGMVSKIVLLEEKISCFHQSERSSGHAGEGLHPYSVSL